MNKSDLIPLVSICLPILNGKKYLQPALDSIKSQKYRNLELIVSDDNSLDNSLDLVKSFKKTWGFPVSIYHHKPTTIGANWNNCLKHANGKYIKFLFQDDLLYPICIEKMVSEAESDEKIGLVFCKREIIVENETDDTIHWKKINSDLQEGTEIFKNNKKINGNRVLKSEFVIKPKNKIGEPTAVLFRNSVLKKVGYFNENLHQVIDIEFYYRVMKISYIYFIEEKLVGFRLHPKQATVINSKRKIDDYELYPYLLYKNYFKYLSRRNQFYLFKKYSSIVEFSYKIFRLLIPKK